MAGVINECPLKVGMRVKKKVGGGTALCRVGTVVRVEPDRNTHDHRYAYLHRILGMENPVSGPFWRVWVLTDYRLSRGHKTQRSYLSIEWEPWESKPEILLDDTCKALVAVYLQGDATAAWGLADRIMELMGGTKRG